MTYSLIVFFFFLFIFLLSPNPLEEEMSNVNVRNIRFYLHYDSDTLNIVNYFKKLNPFDLCLVQSLGNVESYHDGFIR